MSKLIKPSQYAKELGISRQAVYAKIKKGLLKAKKVDGQLFIELDSSLEIQSNKKIASSNPMQNDLLMAKDETIKILKATIEDLKATNNLIIGTLKGEVDLLKEAFNEMQVLYRNQIKQLQHTKTVKVAYKDFKEENIDFIELEELLEGFNLNKKESKRFIKIAKKLQKDGDFRFMKVDNKILALEEADYDDIIELIHSL
jgi:hypothetical protein